MLSFNAAGVAAALETGALVKELRKAFRGSATTPTRHHHRVPVPDAPDAAMLLMPSWIEGRYVGIKLVTVFPGNAARGIDSVQGTYVLLSGTTGEPLASIDGRMLTLRRTACASALAASYLARDDARRLLMIGTGALAPHLIAAHANVRPIREVLVWGRDPDKASRLAKSLDGPRMNVHAASDLESAVRGVDVISCATLSKTPLVRGAWLVPGQHVDLVGSYAPDMREADDEAVRRARVYIDTETALHESGDLVQPLKSGALTEPQLAGTLADLARGRVAGRSSANEITLFKSTGTALEDLAAAM
ncbi:MAG: ornithine cyclodeaminase family protein, partial [Alphaproteobacteria bacterium]|nr:ornithine cyclodeaminase family protein [Alphaproteobacteria bacterium]